MQKDLLYNLKAGDIVIKNNIKYRVKAGLHSMVTLMSDHKVYMTLEVEPINNCGKNELLSVYNCEEFSKMI